MWANGDQSNIQWWPMYQGYQYSNPTQDASADWATRAALWAQQRQAQEEMAKQHQQYYAAVPNQPHQDSIHETPEKPPLPSGDGTDQTFAQDSADPPLPPGEFELPQSRKPEHDGDNLETVAMEDEPLDTPTPEHGVAVTRLDYNHGQPVPLPEVGPPPHLPGMQTFDHNHGFTPAAGTPTPAFVPAQRFDYGHQSANYDHQKESHPPSSQWYDYNHMRGTEQQPYETDRHHLRHSSRSEPPESHVPPASLDFSSMSEVKKKALPLWIREGLEKMEREKQKKQTQELKKSLNSSTSSLSNISGYIHGKIDSPVPSPEKSQSDEEPESSEDEEKVIKKEDKIKLQQSSRKRSLFKKSQSRSLSPQKSDSSDDEVNYKSDSEKQQEMLLRMRKMLTEVLLSVTDDEVHNIAKEAYNEALLAENRQLRSSGGLDILKQGGTLGVGDYGSDSGSESYQDSEQDEPEKRTTEQRLHPVYKKDEHDMTYGRSRSRSPRKHKSNESVLNRSRSGSSESNDKLHEPGSSVSSQEESDISGSTSGKKKKRSKHRRKHRSTSSSPKRRSKHKHRRSRSRSRTPKKRKSSKRDRSRSRSATLSRSSRKAKKHSQSRSRSPSERGRRRKYSRSRSRSSSERGRHRKYSRSRSRSPNERGRHRKYSRSRSRSPSERGRHRKYSRSRSRSVSERGRHRKSSHSRSYSRSPTNRRNRSRGKSPRKRRSRRSRSASSDREGKRGSNRRSRSRSRSSTPRHKRR